ncbi:hypothetical protein, partial [Pseudomonas sp.]|uniref:hypothetical protein n=1 Tax=Pseudomonas sp. TaxID=306 RepID=UPI0032634B27
FASKPAPTVLTEYNFNTSNTLSSAFDPHHSGRLSGRRALAFDLAFDFDLRRPVNHAGRTQA